MSSEIPHISTSDAILRINRLIETKQGDEGRLRYIAEYLQKGKRLFHSDQIYLNKKIEADIIPAPIKKSTEPNEKIKDTKRLIALNFGDSGRLRHILHTLQNKKTLYHSDELYLQSKTEQFNKFAEGKRLKRTIQAKIPSPPQPEIPDEEFYKPIPETFEEEKPVIHPPQDVPEQLQEIENAVLDSEQKESSDLFDLLDDTPKVNIEIEKEREKISKLKLDQDQLKVQKDELSQLIAYRQEYEITINREKEILEREIKIEQDKVKDKDKLVEELIKNQSKLIQTKTEREVLVEQIAIDKAKSEAELKKKQDELEELKKEYEALQKEIKIKKQNIDDQIEKENKKIDKLKDDLDDF